MRFQPAESWKSVVVPGLLACLLGCTSVPTEEEKELELGKRELTIGNARDALDRFARLSKTLASQGLKPSAQVEAEEGICLYQVGRYQEAADVFGKVKFDQITGDTLVEALVHRGHAERELGRRAEPVFIPDTPENRAERTKRSQIANDHYQLARSQYTRVLTELNPKHFEALLGNGECYLRLGILNKSTQFFQKATQILASCPEGKDKRALFFTGRVVQEDLGNGELTLEAAEKISDALLLDRDSNYDFHVAYRDVLALLEPFKTPPMLQAKFDKDSKMLSFVQAFVERLDGYARQGRRPDGEWGKELDSKLQAYLKQYQGWQNSQTGLRENIQRANQIIRAGGEKVYLEAYREAMKLLKEVDIAFQGKTDYLTARREVQEGFVKAHLETGKALTELGEWELAEANLREALNYCVQPYLSESTTTELLLQGQKALEKLSVQRTWTGDRERIRSLLSQGKFDEADSQYQLTKARYTGEKRQFVDSQLQQFDQELGKKDEIAELIHAYQQGLKDENEAPSKALQAFSGALELADKGNLGYWRSLLRRKIATVYYRLDDYQRCLEEMSALAKTLDKKDALNQTDYLLSAKSYFRRGDYELACRNLDEIRDPKPLSPEEKKMAGLAYLKETPPNLVRAKPFLEGASKEDPEVRQGLRSCYRKLIEEWRGRDRAATLELLTSLTELEPGELEARKELGVLLYRIGIETRDPDVCRRAYDHILAASNGGVPPQTDDEKECLGRLLACYARYVPLAVGNTWRYKTSDGNSRVVTVTERMASDRFRVRIDEGGTTSTEVWEQAESGRVLKRHNAQALVTQQLPIQLYAPDHNPTRDYSVIATKYSSKVIATGVTHEVGGRSYQNCIQVRVSSGPTGYQDVYFAPGVGEIEMKQSSGFAYLLSDTQITGDEKPTEGQAS